MKTLEIAAPALKYVFILPHAREYSEVVPALFFLLEFLSDDDSGIRKRASEVVCNILDSIITLNPMAASEQLSEAITRKFDPYAIKRDIINSICRMSYDQVLYSAVRPSNILFAKERSNVWRDELFEFELKIRMLERCWPAEPEDIDKSEQELGRWIYNALSVALDVFKRNDGAFGWSSDVDAFEVLSKIFAVREAMLRYQEDQHLEKFADVWRKAIEGKNSHPYWVEKFTTLLGKKDEEKSQASGSEAPKSSSPSAIVDLDRMVIE